MSTTAGGAERAALELELRLLPGVVNVGTADGGGLAVVAVDPDTALVEAAGRAARLHSFDEPVRVVDLAAPRPRVGLQGRVALVHAEFDPASGTAEVHLAHAERRGAGRSGSGPVVGAVEATLAALTDLGLEVPFYLLSAGPVPGDVGSPTMVVLRPLGSDGGAERIGVARGRSDEEAASRATLGALNRYLSLDEAARAR